MKKPRKSKGYSRSNAKRQRDAAIYEAGGEDANPDQDVDQDIPPQEAANDSRQDADQPESGSTLPALVADAPAEPSNDSLMIIPRHIQREEDRAAKRRALFNSVCNKAADISGRMAVTSVLKIAGASLAIGAGASALGVAAAGIALAGIGSAVYTYGSESYKEYRTRKAQGETVSFVNVLRQNNQTRMRRTLTSLACGVAFGALGAYLMQSDAVQWVVEKAGPVVKGWISSAAGLFGLGAPSAEDVANAATPSAADVVSAPAPEVSAVAPEAPVVEAAPAAAAPAAPVADAVTAPPVAPAASVSADIEVTVETSGDVDVNVDVNVTVDGAAVAESVAVSSADVAADPLAAGLAQAHIASADSVSPQALKDAAHNILRMDGIDAADRVAMARALAQEAAERGNVQAVRFLTDLPRVEAALGLEPGAVPEVAAAPVETPVPAPKPEIVTAPAPVQAPVETALETPVPAPKPDIVVTTLPDVVLDSGADTAATVVAGGQTITPVAPPAPVTVSELPPLAPRFATEAAVCSVTMVGDMPSDINCAVSENMMQPNDYITFVDAAHPNIKVTTTLDGGSVAVATGHMLQEVTLSDGASRLQVAVRAVLGIRR